MSAIPQSNTLSMIDVDLRFRKKGGGDENKGYSSA